MPAALAGTTWPGAVRRSVTCSIAMLAALALSSHDAAAQAPAANDAAASARPLKVLDPAYMDTTVKACTDFFEYADGRWAATDVIPAAYASDGVGRDMTDRNELAVRSVLDDAMAKRHTAAAGSTDRKLGTYYATCMDSTRAESDGMKPLDPMLDTIAAIRTRGALVQTIAALHERGIRAVFTYSPTPDFHDTFHYIAELQQSGLGMPDRNYYTDTGHVADSLRTAYVHHVTRLLVLSGVAQAAAEDDAHHVMALETALARAQLTRVAQREPRNVDHPMSLDSLRALVPNIDWRGYFQRSGLTHAPTHINVNEPGYLRARQHARGQRATRRLAYVSPLPPARAGRTLAQHAVRAGGFLLHVAVYRSDRASPPVETLPPGVGPPARRSPGRGVRREDVLRGRQGPRAPDH